MIQICMAGDPDVGFVEARLPNGCQITVVYEADASWYWEDDSGEQSEPFATFEEAFAALAARLLLRKIVLLRVTHGS